MTLRDPVGPGPRPVPDPLDAALAALAALDRATPTDDGFTEAVMARLEAEAVTDAGQARAWLARLEASRIREARVRRWGLTGVAVGAAAVAAGVLPAVAGGSAPWSPLAVLALGLATSLAAWLVAARAA